MCDIIGHVIQNILFLPLDAISAKRGIAIEPTHIGRVINLQLETSRLNMLRGGF